MLGMRVFEGPNPTTAAGAAPGDDSLVYGGPIGRVCVGGVCITGAFAGAAPGDDSLGRVQPEEADPKVTGAQP